MLHLGTPKVIGLTGDHTDRNRPERGRRHPFRTFDRVSLQWRLSGPSSGSPSFRVRRQVFRTHSTATALAGQAPWQESDTRTFKHAVSTAGFASSDTKSDATLFITKRKLL